MRTSPSNFKKFIKLYLSQAFDSAAYKDANPDVKGAYLYSLWHFSRYAKKERRAWGQDFNREWLLGHIINGRLNWFLARKVMKYINFENRPNHVEVIKQLCDEQNLSLDAYTARQAYAENKFDRAIIALNRIDSARHPIEALGTHYQFATKLGLQAGIEQVFADALEELASGSPLPKDFYIALHETAWALGEENFQGQNVLRTILAHMERTKYRNTRSLRQDLWDIGLPLINGTSDIDQAIWNEVPKNLKRKVRNEPELKINSNFHPLLSALAANALGLKHTFTQTADQQRYGTNHIKAKQQVAHIRILPAIYWQAQSMQSVLASHLAAFQHVITAFEKKGYALFPTPAGQIYDIGHCNLIGDIVLSYHSYTSSLKGTSKKPTIVHIKESALPNYYQFDRCGFSGWACPKLNLTIDDKVVDTFYENLVAETIEKGISKYEQPECGTLKIAPGFVFVPLQIQNDSVIQLANYNIFDALENLARDNTFQRDIVVKLHPKDTSKVTARRLETLQARYPKIKILNHSISDLVTAASVVLTVNSGVGAEALLRYTPVVTLGHADYSEVAFPVESLSTLQKTLNTAIYSSSQPEFKRSIRRYIYAFYSTNCFHVETETNADILFSKFKTILPSHGSL